MASDTVQRFFGGSPGGVILRLIILSLVVGVILSALGIDPLDIFKSFRSLIQRIYNMGFETIEWLFRYFLIGAVIVIPIWLIIRIVKFGQRRA